MPNKGCCLDLKSRTHHLFTFKPQCRTVDKQACSPMSEVHNDSRAKTLLYKKLVSLYTVILWSRLSLAAAKSICSVPIHLRYGIRYLVDVLESGLGLLVDPVGHGLDLFLRENTLPGRHRSLTVADLVLNSLLVPSSVKVLFHGGLGKSVALDDVVSASLVASTAVGLEDGGRVGSPGSASSSHAHAGGTDSHDSTAGNLRSAHGGGDVVASESGEAESNNKDNVEASAADEEELLHVGLRGFDLLVHRAGLPESAQPIPFGSSWHGSSQNTCRFMVRVEIFEGKASNLGSNPLMIGSCSRQKNQVPFETTRD
mmetsp:Transcript_2098/g.4217  ORF Transcript_2098/g.4217 Transcript_2098/m.4217 type:complete len:313 (-) Transcript_2098:943-1881(-)